MNNNLIKLFEKEADFNDEDFKTILFSINDNIFNELKLYLYDKINYFQDCLKLYLNKDFNITGKKFPDSQQKMDKNLFDTLVPKITYWLLNHKIMDEFL